MRYYTDTELESILDDDDFDDDTFEDFDAVEDDDDEDEAFYFEDDDNDEGYFGEDDDDDEAESDALGERRYFRRRRLRGRRRRRGFRRAPRRSFRLRGRRKAVVTTRGGRSAVVNFNKSFATTAEVKKAVDTLAKDVRRNGGGIKRLDREIKRVDGSSRKALTKQNNRLSAFEKSIKKQIKAARDEAKQSALLPLLMKREPQLQSVNIVGEGLKTIAPNTTVYADDGNDALTLLALTGGLGGSGDKGGLDTTTLLLLTGALN